MLSTRAQSYSIEDGELSPKPVKSADATTLFFEVQEPTKPVITIINLHRLSIQKNSFADFVEYFTKQANKVDLLTQLAKSTLQFQFNSATLKIINRNFFHNIAYAISGGISQLNYANLAQYDFFEDELTRILEKKPDDYIKFANDFVSLNRHMKTMAEYMNDTDINSMREDVKVIAAYIKKRVEAKPVVSTKSIFNKPKEETFSFSVSDIYEQFFGKSSNPRK